MRTDRLSDGDERAWRALAERAAEPNPFFSPDYVLPAVYGRGEPADLLVVTRDGRWEACVPFQRARRWRFLPLPCLVPWLRTYAYLATPLVDRDALDTATAALGRALSNTARAAFTVLDPVDPEGPAGAALLANVSKALVYMDARRAAIRRRSEPTYLEAAFSRKRWQRLRRLRRRLERDLGGAAVVRNRSDDPAAWEAFLDLERRGWKGAHGTALASRQGDAAFFRRMCAAMSSAGKLQILSLECGDRVAAMQCNLVDAGVVFTLKVAYEPELARYSPGLLLEIDSICVFHDIGAEMVDSCAEPTNELLNRLWPDRRPIQTVIVRTTAPAGRAVPTLAHLHLAAARAVHAGQSLGSGRAQAITRALTAQVDGWRHDGGRTPPAGRLGTIEPRRTRRVVAGGARGGGQSEERVEWLRGDDVLAQLGAEWDALAMRQAHPFMRREWLTTWWSAFGRGRELVVCIARRNGTLVAGMPLSSGRGNLAVLANDHTPLVVPLAADATALTAVARAIAAADVNALRLAALPRDHPATVALLDAARDAGRLAAVEAQYVSPITTTTGSFDDYRARKKAGWRELERRMRKASRERGMALRLVECPVGATAFLDAGLMVEASGWKGRGNTAILSAPETAEFYRTMAEAFARRGELALSGLWFDDRLVAFDLALLYANRYWLLKTGYDESVRTLAPGLILRRAVIERCFELGLDAHEFLGPDMPWKRLFSTDERAHCACRAYRRGPLGIAQWSWRRARPPLRHVYRRVQALADRRP